MKKTKKTLARPKLFIADSRAAESAWNSIIRYCMRRELEPPEMQLHRKRGLERIPDGFDLYIVHLADLDSLDVVKEFRKYNPHLPIFARHGGGYSPMADEDKKLFDRIIYDGAWPYNEETTEELINHLNSLVK